MAIVNRKVEYRLYPTPAQERRMWDLLGAHQRLYNAALEQRQLAWRMQGKSVTFAEQCRQLTELRAEDEAYAELNAQSCQVTLKRLDLAFQHFFRRVKAGEKPGFPRFKAYRRYSGWGYKTHGDGWKLLPGDAMRHGYLRLSGVGILKMRGKARTEGAPKTCELLHKDGKWYASVTLDCEPLRRGGRDACGLDWGVETFATVALSDGTTDNITNPRYLRRQLKYLRRVQREIAKKKRGGKNRVKCRQRLASLHRKVANARRDFLHQTSALLVGRLGLIATETLAVKGMTAKGGSYKKGLNREILSTAPAAFLAMLRYKAEEAGIQLVEVPTRQVKPSQTCSGCGKQAKKPLAERHHRCECGLVIGRDENAARVMLNWALSGRPAGWEPSGRGEAGSLASVSRETPAIP
jgi:putative transposase